MSYIFQNPYLIKNLRGTVKTTILYMNSCNIHLGTFMAFESKKCTSFFCAKYSLMTAMWQQKEFYLHGCISFSSVSLKITFFWHSIMRMDYGNIFLSWVVEDKSYTVNDFLIPYWTNIFSIKVWYPYEFGSQITNYR